MEPRNLPDPQGPVLLSLGRRDTSRLLEVYVKRSLSLNDGSLPRLSQTSKASKWMTVAKGLKPGPNRSSSDACAHPRRPRLAEMRRVPSTIEASREECSAEPPLPSFDSPERSLRENARKPKNRSVLKSFLGLFSRKGREEKEVRELSKVRAGACAAPEGPAQPVSFLLTHDPVGTGELDSRRSQKSLGKKRSPLALSLHTNGLESAQTQRTPSFRILPGTGQPEAVVCVEPVREYYEKVSEELERIVKEVKDSPVEEGTTFAAAIQTNDSAVAAEDEGTIEKIISLLKQQGDDINGKINDSPTLSSFFQSLSYRGFQQLADRYVEEEVPSNLPEDTAAPELVKLAFTLDFTAKVAGLSNQAVSRIMGFGNQYLQDRFTQMSKAQPLVSQEEAFQSFMGPD